MKKNPDPQFHFSAYPLSIIGGVSSSTLKVKRTAPVVSFKIFPELDKLPKEKPGLPGTDSVQEDNQLDIGWFNNYE